MRAAAAVLVALALAACTARPPQAPPGPGVVAIAISEPGAPLTPAHADDPVVARLLPALTAGLVAPLPDGGVALELAESIETRDHRRFVVTLREGLRFSDGTELTAGSFVEAWRHADLAREEGEGRGAFAGLRGVRGDTGVDLVETGALELLDERSFAIRLARADPEFPRELALPEFLPLPASALEDPAGFEAHPVGAGPYMLAGEGAWIPGDRLELVPNPRYRGEREARNGGLSFRFLGDGQVALAELLAREVDVVERLPREDVRRVDELLGGRVARGPLPRLELLVPPDDERAFRGEEGQLRRTAIAILLDRSVMAEQLLEGAAEPATGFLPTVVELPETSMPWGERASDERARALWRQANGLAAWEGPITIGVVGGTPDEDLAEAIALRITAALSIDAVVARFVSEELLRAEIDEEGLPAFTLRTATLRSGSVAGGLETVVPGSLAPGGFTSRLERAAEADTPEASIMLAAQAQGPLATALPVIPIWTPTVRAGFAPGIEGVGLGWGGVLDYWLLETAP